MMGHSSVLSGLFLIALLYGNVTIKFPLPAPVFLLPLILGAAFRQHGLVALKPNAGVALLCGMFGVAGLQALGGMPIEKADLTGYYLPIFYAIATLGAFWLVPTKDTIIEKALVAGGLITAAVMVLSIISGLSSIDLDPSLPMRSFYQLKSFSSNALGKSNYIAVFLVFIAAVALFSRNYKIAGLFSILAGLTWSRFAIVALLALGLLWWLSENRKVSSTAILAVIAAAACVVLAGMVALADTPFGSSIAIRAELLFDSIAPFWASPLIGAPRTTVMAEFGNDITWSPHNSVATVLVNFGVVGLLLYGGYIVFGMRSIYRAGTRSAVWRGVFFGFVVLLLWSMTEIIVLTPAFEMLFAFMFAVSRHAHREVPAQSAREIATAKQAMGTTA